MSRKKSKHGHDTSPPGARPKRRTAARASLQARLDALTADPRVVRVKKRQQAPDEIGALSPHEARFRDEVIRRSHGRFLVYRTQDGEGLGDFILVDASNPNNPLAIAMDLKMPAGSHQSGHQLREARALLKRAGFDRVVVFTGNPDEFFARFGL